MERNKLKLAPPCLEEALRRGTLVNVNHFSDFHSSGMNLIGSSPFPQSRKMIKMADYALIFSHHPIEEYSYFVCRFYIPGKKKRGKNPGKKGKRKQTSPL